MPRQDQPSLADDILTGAPAIAKFLFGNKSAVRAVYRLSTEVPSKHRPPFFKLGSNTLCARKSTLLEWIAEKEAAHQKNAKG